MGESDEMMNTHLLTISFGRSTGAGALAGRGYRRPRFRSIHHEPTDGLQSLKLIDNVAEIPLPLPTFVTATIGSLAYKPPSYV